MKKFFMLLIMVVVIAMSANAQVPAGIYQGPERVVNTYLGWAYLENHTKVCFRNYPCGGNWVKVGMSIPDAYMYAMYEAAMEEEMHYMPSPTSVANYAGMYGGYGMYPMYGGHGRSISIGNEHWGFSTSSSNYGGYKTSSTGIRIGSFHIGTSNAGYTSSSSYEAQKKSDAKQAAQRYSNMKNNVAATGSSARSASKVREVNIRDLMASYK